MVPTEVDGVIGGDRRSEAWRHGSSDLGGECITQGGGVIGGAWAPEVTPEHATETLSEVPGTAGDDPVAAANFRDGSGGREYVPSATGPVTGPARGTIVGSGGNLTTRCGVVLAAVSMAATLAVGANVGATTAPSEPAFDLDAAAAAFVGDNDGGVAVLVVRDGVTTTAAAGVANAAGEPMTTDAVFRIGSLTKAFVATIVMQLVDEGLVDLDAPLSTYLPDTPFGGDVTVRDLLRHRSGVPNYLEDADFMSEVLTDRARVFTPDEILGFIADTPPANRTSSSPTRTPTTSCSAR